MMSIFKKARAELQQLFWERNCSDSTTEPSLRSLIHSTARNEDSYLLSYAPRRHKGSGVKENVCSSSSLDFRAATSVCRYTDLQHFQSLERLWYRHSKPKGFYYLPLVTMPHSPIMALLGIAHSFYQKSSECLGDSFPRERRDPVAPIKKNVAMATEESAVLTQDVSKQSGETVPKLGQGVTSTTTSDTHFQFSFRSSVSLLICSTTTPLITIWETPAK